MASSLEKGQRIIASAGAHDSIGILNRDCALETIASDGGVGAGKSMTQRLANQYRRWFDYEKDSHAKVLASLEAADEQIRSAPSFQKALDLMAHLGAARRMWLFRFGVTNERVELFPRDVSLAELRLEFAKMEASWSSYLNELNDIELARVFAYQSYEGSRFSNTIEDILTQLFGHSWYHRGQIAQLLRMLGAEPAVTDFVFWAREPLDEK